MTGPKRTRVIDADEADWCIARINESKLIVETEYGLNGRPLRKMLKGHVEIHINILNRLVDLLTEKK